MRTTDYKFIITHSFSFPNLCCVYKLIYSAFRQAPSIRSSRLHLSSRRRWFYEVPKRPLPPPLYKWGPMQNGKSWEGKKVKTFSRLSQIWLKFRLIFVNELFESESWAASVHFSVNSLAAFQFVSFSRRRIAFFWLCAFSNLKLCTCKPSVENTNIFTLKQTFCSLETEGIFLVMTRNSFSNF